MAQDTEYPRQLDITAPEFAVQVEIDERRHILYVHVDGYTALRICRIPGKVEVIKHEEEKPDLWAGFGSFLKDPE